MKKIQETAWGKINLALAITGTRADGYHNIDTVFQTIALADTVTIEESDVFSLTCSEATLPCDETNLAYRAWQALLPYRKDQQGVAIHLEKRLPLAAGLAGGSADGAAVLRGLNRLWQLHLSQDQLCQIGAQLGADVPFCLYGGTMRGRGIGEKLIPLPPLPHWQVLLVHPRVSVSTKKAYARFDQQEIQRKINVDKVEEAVRQADFFALTQAMGNTFEELVLPNLPQVRTWYQKMKELGLSPLMSGSGPTLFALVPQNLQEKVARTITDWPDVDVYLIELVEGRKL